ncbi:hypothetical protein W822_18810 [Advenella kashmirensis W13003]|uniref:Uncharacterized protein n=1 Tax=Advenella kashmirensis W13003 TaxID=1424334 RepID=V8QP44_9BURK|nr:hypothetical protein W822_18810 [Advenella kashmirensis W13003]
MNVMRGSEQKVINEKPLLKVAFSRPSAATSEGGMTG